MAPISTEALFFIFKLLYLLNFVKVNKFALYFCEMNWFCIEIGVRILLYAGDDEMMADGNTDQNTRFYGSLWRKLDA